jgi:hypothetical protein
MLQPGISPSSQIPISSQIGNVWLILEDTSCAAILSPLPLSLAQFKLVNQKYKPTLLSLGLGVGGAAISRWNGGGFLELSRATGF